ncbi:polymer-forming cytoskeletal protein [Haloferax sp. AB510]|uniref:bactofilin family protein n=1 Tax=Haloferax sp. AB510 TaxID=2934172 RepID=UPI00209BFEF5|nr:polymer-forming cytoskeletal protein [Haloferax sp. AB510]MCO8267250.1 polymer-forming cytoskeletal protein [Haloferax sp. AB510]
MFTTKQLVAVLLSLLVVGSLAGVAAAQQGPAAGGAVVVGEGETVDGDLDAVGGTVVIAGTVTGDVSATSGTVLVTETGVINGNLDGVAGSVTIEGTVNGDVSLAGGAVFVRDTAKIDGSLDAAGGTVQLDGAVAGNVRVGAEELAVGPTARVGGSLEYDAATATVDSAAVVDGGVRQVDGLVVASPVVAGAPFQFGQFEAPVIPGWVVSGYWLLANFVLGAIIVLVAPDFARRVTGLGTKKAVRSGGVGLLAIVAVPIVLLLLLLTIVGIPLSLAGGVGFLLVLWVAGIYGALVLGTWLLSLADYDNRWAALFAGLFVLAVLDFVPLGGVLEFVVLLVGLGAFALALRGESGDDGDESVSAPDEGPQEGSPMA